MKLSTFSFAALATAAQPRAASAPGTAAAAPLSKKDEMAARKLQQAKDAVATLATVKTQTSDDQKARAKQKVQELKARLQALRMIYANDPKKLARLAAQIARELAGAVRSYTSAGGSAGDIGAAGASDAVDSAAVSPGEATGEDLGAAEAPEDTSDVSAEAAPQGDEAADDPNETRPDATAATDGKSARQAADEKADEAFKAEARDLARALKAALRRKDPKQRDEEDARAGEQALAEVDQAVGALPVADVTASAATI